MFKNLQDGIENNIIKNTICNNNIYTHNDYYKMLNNCKLIKNKFNTYCQIGGNDKHYIIKYMDEKYTFELLDDEYSTYKMYILKALNSDIDCVILNIDKENKIATLNNLTVGDNIKCSETIINNVGSHLVSIVIKLVQKYKDKFNVNTIMLTDHSFLYCNRGKTNIHLGDLQMLKTGDTFYGKFGFLPYAKDDNYRKMYIKSYNNNKRIIQRLLVKDSHLLYYLNKFQINNKNIDITNLINLAIKYNNNKLSSYIIKISSKKNFNDTCTILHYIIPLLIKKNKLTSFYNGIFYLPYM